MIPNVVAAIHAISKDIKLFLVDLSVNQSFLGFAIGIIVAFFAAGFIITKNPNHIPLILKYSSLESFQKISETDADGTYQMSFANFIKVYTQIRLLSLIAFISFCVMVATIVLIQR